MSANQLIEALFKYEKAKLAYSESVYARAPGQDEAEAALDAAVREAMRVAAQAGIAATMAVILGVTGSKEG